MDSLFPARRREKPTTLAKLGHDCCGLGRQLGVGQLGGQPAHVHSQLAPRASQRLSAGDGLKLRLPVQHMGPVVRQARKGQVERIQFGLEKFREPNEQTLAELLKMPFRSL